MEIKIKPFLTPNFVRVEVPPESRDSGFSVVPCFPLKDVPAEDLNKLCNDFRKEVFRKAEKEDRWT